MKLHNGCFPSLVKVIELDLLLLDDLKVELVALGMLSLVLGSLICDLLLHELVYLRCQEEGDLNQFGAHASEI